MRGTAGLRVSSVPFLWPALAAVSASELAATFIKDFAGATVAADTDRRSQPEPRWATRNRIVLELATVRLRAFAPNASARAGRGVTLVVAPSPCTGPTSSISRAITAWWRR